MIAKETLDFLQKLADNNSKEWMDLHRNLYIDAKQDFEKAIAGLLTKMEVLGIDSENIQAKSCIFRINRDIRFSNNKAPYKNNFGAGISNGGRKSAMAGYYLHLQPGQSFIGAGMWMPDAEILKKIRQEIDYNFSEFLSIIENKEFVNTVGAISGERLKNPPKGYEKDNSAVEYLKFKSFTIGKKLNDKEILDKKMQDKVLADFKTMAPFVAFLNRAMD